jgi:hypothetical protein
MDIQEELLKAIEIIVDRKIDNSSPVQTVTSVVKDKRDGKFLVAINGGDYWVNNGTNMTFNVGSLVWVHVPGDLNNAFIIAKR